MKHLILLLSLLMAFSTTAFAQNADDCTTISLKNKTEIKAAEPCILQLAEFVLSKPLATGGDPAHQARKAILGWMEATPDHQFSLNGEVMKVFKGDNLLLFGTYMCCLAKAALTKKSDLHKAALGLLIEYVESPENGVKKTGPIKKLIKKWEKDDVGAYLN